MFFFLLCNPKQTISRVRFVFLPFLPFVLGCQKREKGLHQTEASLLIWQHWLLDVEESQVGWLGTLCGGGCRLRRAVNAATEWAGWVWSWLWRPPESAVVESKPSSSSSPQQLSWKRCQSTKSTRSCTRTTSGTTPAPGAIHGNTIASVGSPPQKLIISEATPLTHLRTSICSMLINSKPVKDHVREKTEKNFSL